MKSSHIVNTASPVQGLLSFARVAAMGSWQACGGGAGDAFEMNDRLLDRSLDRSIDRHEGPCFPGERIA